MKPPAISVVLPAWNAAATLPRAIDSIRLQSSADWELLVIDDGSTDDTPRILREFAPAEPRLRVLTQPHRGVVAALNAGMANARGGFIARMDADDEAHPERLAAQAEWLSTQPAIGLASCLVAFGGDPVANAGYALHVDWINSLITADQIALNRFIESPLAHPSVMFRRELVSVHGGYADGDFPEDYELWLRWLDAGIRMAKVPRVLLRWNDPPGRLSRHDPRYAPEAFARVKARWIAREIGRMESRRSRGAGPRPVWIWGAGRPTRKRAASLAEHGVRIAGYIDVDPKKATCALGGTGVPVIVPERLPQPDEVLVLGYVSNRGAREHIRAELNGRGFVEGRDFLMCA